MPPQARRIVVARAGGPERLRLETFALPTPGVGEVRIANEACGVAFADVLLRQGLYPGYRLPATPGYEVVGRIDACGIGVDDSVGAYVAALTVVGGYASHAIVPAADLVRVPETLAPEVAAALVLNGVTALQLMERCFPPDCSSIAIFGAAGGVGSMLLASADERSIRRSNRRARSRSIARTASGLCARSRRAVSTW